MNIDEDIKRIAEFLLFLSSSDNEVVTTIYSANFTSRHPDDPYYQNPNSIIKMIKDGVLKLIETSGDGQLSPDNSVIHYFTSYKVTFRQKNIKNYLSKIESGQIVNVEPSKEVYEWNELVLNLENATLTYKNNSPKNNISKTREIRLLRLLMKKHGNVVNYLEVAKEVGIDTSDEDISPRSINKAVAEDIHKIRRDLIDNYLIPVGMKAREAKSIIINIRSTGYKLG